MGRRHRFGRCIRTGDLCWQLLCWPSGHYRARLWPRPRPLSRHPAGARGHGRIPRPHLRRDRCHVARQRAAGHRGRTPPHRRRPHPVVRAQPPPGTGDRDTARRRRRRAHGRRSCDGHCAGTLWRIDRAGRLTVRQLSIAFQTDKPLAAYGPLAAAAEGYGFDAVTVYNDMLYQPAWLPLLEMARATQRITLGVAAVNPFTCHPINIAGNIALIDEASNGRAYLGIARGGWLDFVGVTPRRPVIALREAMACVRHLLRRDPAPLA